MAEQIFRKWFEEQLRFRLHDGTEEDNVFLGASEFLPVIVAREFGVYEQELINWRDGEWKPRQHELREELLNYSANGNRYVDLIDAVRRQQVIPFVGSGMSVPSGLPTWAEFLLKTGEYAQCDSSELVRLIDCAAFEEAADLLADRMNPLLFAERVEHELRITEPNSINGPVCLLPRLFPSLVMTTNLDNVLESLYEWCELPFSYTLNGKEISDYRRLKDPEERFLIKLHGDCQNQHSRVLLSTEFDEAYAAESPLRDEVTLLYRQNSLLFLGCSLGSDRTVRLVNDIADSDKHMPKHYAFLTRPGSKADRIARENSLAERGIFAIWYDLPHDDAIMALLDGLYQDATL